MTDEFNPLYYNAVDQIYHFEHVAPLLLRLEMLREMIRTLWPDGHPTRVVHITGTSGKGSVSRFLEAGLGLRGKAGGLFSPHLFDYRERFSIAGEFASQDDILATWEERIKPYCLEVARRRPDFMPMFREINVLMALALFEQHGVEWAAVEAGVGARYDHTSAFDAVGAAITNVGDDHPIELGPERWMRALDKAGICRPGKPLFSAVGDEESQRVIERVCEASGSPLIVVTPDYVDGVREALSGLTASIPHDGLLGPGHQAWNAALALRIVQHFMPDLPTAEVLEAFAGVRLRGRFEEIQHGVFIDVAHNVNKISALVAELERRFPEDRIIFLVGLSKMRQAGEVLSPILSIAERVIITMGFHEDRPAEAVRAELEPFNRRSIPLQVIPNPREAFAVARGLRGDDGLLVITGSTFLIEQVLNPDPYMRAMNVHYGWRARTRHG
ncbi:MAG: folylpolyglutamate synthase/dihydrofolate synthase family protein [Anaerolineae bacterium]